MTVFSIILGICFAYWWHFQRETQGEREFREKQQQKSLLWDKYNMSNLSSKPTQLKQTEMSEWDKHNIDQFK